MDEEWWTGHICEICKESATYGVIDIVQTQDSVSGFFRYDPYDPPHYFCQAHKREAEILIFKRAGE